MSPAPCGSRPRVESGKERGEEREQGCEQGRERFLSRLNLPLLVGLPSRGPPLKRPDRVQPAGGRGRPDCFIRLQSPLRHA
ncbi:hypothetical protein NDU88_001135 [Pleurodeles waltl]|uniref:Uncharacterized protein n=1 Tax=Pleurodeles waltl TaxID=8319 RepID=A0AAV7UUH1_PLEWA|nr:hypothetical protein NDU88_001135 [Pleurodeles waltl]